jgi:hypothetical protein
LTCFKKRIEFAPLFPKLIFVNEKFKLSPLPRQIFCRAFGTTHSSRCCSAVRAYDRENYQAGGLSEQFLI